MVCVEGSPYRCERGILVMIKIVNLVGVFALLGQGVWAQCSDGVVDLRWDGGNARFNVELAINEEERSRLWAVTVSGFGSGDARWASPGLLSVCSEIEGAADTFSG